MCSADRTDKARIESVTRLSRRAFAAAGLSTRVEDETTCCYAVQDKVWVNGVDEVPWEVYTVLSDSVTASGAGTNEQCCTSDSMSVDGSTDANCC